MPGAPRQPGCPTMTRISLLALAAVAVLGVAPQAHAADAPAAQLGPRPFFLVDDMADSDLKTALKACANGPFYRTQFTITLGVACCLAASAVGVVGPIIFVGLMCPHLARFMAGRRTPLVLQGGIPAGLKAVSVALMPGPAKFPVINLIDKLTL